jgi:hypothetical protein
MNTTTTKKPTKRTLFTEILNTYNLSDEHIAFIKHELELLDKKNVSGGEKKPTAQQVANEVLKANIVEQMEPNRLYSIAEMSKELPCCADLSSSKITAMMTQLKNENKVVRTEDKRKVYYSLAE